MKTNRYGSFFFFRYDGVIASQLVMHPSIEPVGEFKNNEEK